MSFGETNWINFTGITETDGGTVREFVCEMYDSLEESGKSVKIIMYEGAFA